jgi:cell filamentation protein
MSDPVYCYPPDYTVLKNRLGLTDPDALDRFERRSVAQRGEEGTPPGRFDLAHLRAIHRHLFQDVYDWAGELRTVEISKGGNQFQFRRYIETGMADVYRRIKERKALNGLDVSTFSIQASDIIGDINYVHPFREGNGRTLLHYLKRFAAQAGHPCDLRHVDKTDWLEASKAAHRGVYEPIGACIRHVLLASAPSMVPER